MPEDVGGAEEEKERLGRYPLQILAQEDTLKGLEQKDFASQVTLAAILAQLNITLSALRDALRGASNKDFSTLESDIESILAKLNVNLSTRASQTTLASILGDTSALNDDSAKGLMRTMGDAGATPTNKTGKTLLKLLDDILTQTSDHAFGMMGYDYAGAAQAQLAVDPTTKALLVNLKCSAADIDIVDAGGLITATEVESALQEIFDDYQAGGVSRTLGGDLDANNHSINNLLGIGAVPISATQWDALGALVEWTAWVPTLTDGANLSGYTVARYYRLGDLCFFYFTADNKDITTAGTLQVTLPFTVANTGRQTPTGSIHDGAAWVGQTNMGIIENTNYMAISKNAAGDAWAGDETGVFIRISGFFEIA